MHFIIEMMKHSAIFLKEFEYVVPIQNRKNWFELTQKWTLVTTLQTSLFASWHLDTVSLICQFRTAFGDYTIKQSFCLEVGFGWIYSIFIFKFTSKSKLKETLFLKRCWGITTTAWFYEILTTLKATTRRNLFS